MKKVLITGANGYIGSHLISEISKYQDYFFVVAADLESDNLPKYIKFMQVDLTKDYNKSALYELAGNPDILIHLAWRNGFDHNASSHMDDLSAHFSFIKNLSDRGTSQFIVAGSFREYGSVNGLVDQNRNVIAENLYTLSKSTLRRALEIYFNNTSKHLQWIRPFTVYGDDTKNNSILSKIIQWEAEGKRTFPFTDGNEMYDYIHVLTLAKQIVAIASQTDVTGIIDCCSGVPTRLGDMVDNFIRVNHFKIRPDYGAYQRRDYDSPVIYGDNRKIKQIMDNCVLFNH